MMEDNVSILQGISNMTLSTNHSTLIRIIRSCWNDETLKHRFIQQPELLLSEYGIDVSDDVRVKVVENSRSKLHIVLPANSFIGDKEGENEFEDWADGTWSCKKRKCTE